MKNIIKICAFGIGMCIILSVLSAVFRGGPLYKRNLVLDYDTRIAGIQNEPEGQIDVLFVGDSLCVCGITPMVIYRDYGITSYNMGRVQQKTVDTYFCIKEAMKRQHIKVVMWEGHSLTKQFEGTDPWNYGLAGLIRYKSQMIMYHNFWKPLVDGRRSRKQFKGFEVNDTISPRNKKNKKFKYVSDWVMQYDQEYLLSKVQKLCEENGARLILFIAPSYICYKDDMYEEFQRVADRHGLLYLNADKNRKAFNLDWDKDTIDKGDHLNLTGAEKLSGYLGEFLMKECDLEDHREDPEYSSWNDLIPAYEQERLDMKGTSYPKMEKEAGIPNENLILTPMDKDKYEKKEKKKKEK